MKIIEIILFSNVFEAGVESWAAWLPDDGEASPAIPLRNDQRFLEGVPGSNGILHSSLLGGGSIRGICNLWGNFSQQGKGRSIKQRLASGSDPEMQAVLFLQELHQSNACLK